jgi:uncharacterized membrane protein YbhN (UPF0104 family)
MSKQQLKTLGLFALKLTGTVLFLTWALSQIDAGDSLWENLTLALRSPFWVATGLALAFLSVVTSAMRWHFLLKAQGIHESFTYILRLTFYSAFFNIASLGGTAGDAAKILLLIRRRPDKKVGIGLSVMADHVIGYIAGSLIFLLFTWGFDTMDKVTDPVGRKAFVAATWFQAGGLIFLILSVISCMPGVLAFGRRCFPRLTRSKHISTITSVIDLFRLRWHYALYSFAVSLVLATTYYLAFFAALRSLGQAVSPVTILSIMPVVDVISALPISISGLGVREKTFDFFLSQLTGIDKATAIAAPLIGFAFQLFWGIAGGLMIILARGSSRPTPNPVVEPHDG